MSYKTKRTRLMSSYFFNEREQLKTVSRSAPQRNSSKSSILKKEDESIRLQELLLITINHFSA